MATLTIQTPTKSGATLSRAAITAGGDVFTNNGRTSLIILNGGVTGSVVITLVTAGKAGGLAIADNVITIPKTTGNEFVAGPFDPTIYNDANGQISITYSGDAGDLAATTIAAVSL